MLIKIITVLNPSVSMGHYKRSLLLRKTLKKRNHSVELTVLEKDPYTSLLQQYEESLVKKNFNFIIFDISNKLIFTKNLLNLIEKIITKYSYKVVITDSLGKDAIHLLIKRKNFILHLPYFLSKNDFNILNKKYKFSMLGLKFSIVDKLKTNKPRLEQKPKILITFGASDKFNKSYNFLKSIVKICNIKILFIVGPFFKSKLVKKIKKLEKKTNNLKIVKFKDTLIKYLSYSDMIITNSGLSKYESIFTKKPVMVIYETKELFKMNKNFIKEKLAFNFFYDKRKLEAICQKFIQKKFNFISHIKNREKILSSNLDNNFEKYLSKIYKKENPT